MAQLSSGKVTVIRYYRWSQTQNAEENAEVLQRKIRIQTMYSFELFNSAIINAILLKSTEMMKASRDQRGIC